MNPEPSFPLGIITQIRGKCIVMRGSDIDTDRIIPARFLKCVSFQALGEAVFADDRTQLKGEHPFDLSKNQNASILIVNENFGCGSSREHAPQALLRWGIRAIIGQSFAEIFYGNCLALGIPCVTTTEADILQIQNTINNDSNENWSLNLTELKLKNPYRSWDIKMNQGPLEMLISGNWDITSQLLNNDKKITDTIKKVPYLNNFIPIK